jgi:hypothetical protein
MPRGFRLTDFEDFAGTAPLTVIVANSRSSMG